MGEKEEKERIGNISLVSLLHESRPIFDCTHQVAREDEVELALVHPVVFDVVQLKSHVGRDTAVARRRNV